MSFEGADGPGNRDMTRVPRFTPGVFVTGTGTGVGKTLVSRALARFLRRNGVDVGVMKPVETGRVDENVLSDAAQLKAAAGVDDGLDRVCPVALRAPVAPSVAAQMEDCPIRLATILDAYAELRSRRSFMIVEGAGGLAVPLFQRFLMADLAREMDLPVLIVSPSGLGAINLCVLTTHFARSMELEVAGILLNDSQGNEEGVPERTNPEVIGGLACSPVFGRFPHVTQDDPSPDQLADHLESAVGDAIIDILGAKRSSGATRMENLIYPDEAGDEAGAEPGAAV